MDEQRKALAARLEEEKKKKAQKKPEESLWTRAAKSGLLGTKAQITAEADESRKK